MCHINWLNCTTLIKQMQFYIFCFHKKDKICSNRFANTNFLPDVLFSGICRRIVFRNTFTVIIIVFPFSVLVKPVICYSVALFSLQLYFIPLSLK